MRIVIKTLKRILDLSGKYKGDIYIGIISSLLQSLFSAADIFGVLYLTMHLTCLTPQIIRNAFLILLAGLIGKCFFKWQITRKVSGAGYDIFQDVRLDIGDKLKTAPMGYFNQRQLGEIQTAATTNITDLENSAMVVVESIIGGVLYSFISTLILLIFDLRIGLVTLAGQLVGCVFLYVVQRNAKKEAHLRFEAQEKMTGRAMEFIQGISVMRLFNTANDGVKDVREAFAGKRKADLRIEKAAMWPVSLYRYTFKVVSCLIILIAALLCLKGDMSFAYMVMFLFSAFAAFSQTDGIAANMAVLRVVDSALDHTESVLNIPVMEGKERAENIKEFNIDLINVSFSYGDREVIHDVNVHIPENTVTAIVGPSGSGKTTLCNLIARFWDVQSGQILIGGHNIKEINNDELMTKFSFVFQNVYLFHDTIENNIKFGKPDATMEEIVEAAKKARCHDFIMQLPEGYQTVVGEGGSTLSGGEKQRISIVRAILKDAPIIILDEATSSVDPENQHLLIEAFHELTKDKTLITIAHRLSTIRNADQILVMEDGKIVQSGTHEELMEKQGIYRRFLMLLEQSAAWNI